LLKTPGIPSMPEYSSSKTALNHLTVQWAMEEQKNGSGTRVVSICPGAFSASSSAPKNLGPGQLGQQSEFDWNGKGRAGKCLSGCAAGKHSRKLTGHRSIIRCLGLKDVSNVAPK
jgi:NAD(P)-dependent dehydrogenase (short-subunit alcohol dehydrogenase family)